VKKFGGQSVVPGNIIIRQRGTKWHPGDYVGIGKDHTIFAKIAGQVVFRESGGRSFVSVARRRLLNSRLHRTTIGIEAGRRPTVSPFFVLAPILRSRVMKTQLPKHREPTDQMRQPTVLRTARLVLRAPRKEDAPALVAMLNDVEMVRYTEFLPHPYTLDDAHQFIAGQSQPNAHGIQDAFLACMGDSDGSAIGCVGYRGSTPPDMEIGYWVGRAHWGEGFAREMTEVALDHAFTMLGAVRVTAEAVAVNAASLRVLARLGFTNEGDSTCQTRMLGDQPARRYAMTAHQWASLRQGHARGASS
jgi:ribosomal protein L27